MPARNDEDTGIKHMTCAEMNRGSIMTDVHWQALIWLAVQPLIDSVGYQRNKDIINDLLRIGYAFIFCKKWVMQTDKGKQALADYRKRREAR
jgi:hypothetical protein